MTEQISVETAVNGLARSMTTQLQNLLSLLGNNVSTINEALDNDVEAYNTLADECEKLQTERNSLELKLNSLSDSHQQDKLEIETQIAELTKTITRQNIKLGTFAELKKQLKELKEMNPKAMKERLANYRKKNEDQAKEVIKLRTENKKYRTENSSHIIEKAKLEKVALEAGNAHEELKQRLLHNDGDVIEKRFKGKDNLECAIYYFHWPMNFIPIGGEVSTIGDFNFHIEIRTSYAINFIPSCSAWGVLFWPEISEIEGKVPNGLVDEATKIFRERMEISHEYLIDRIDWAKSEDLHDVEDLTERQLELLNGSNVLTVYSVSHMSELQLEKRVKGMGSKGIKQVREAVRSHVEKWERENWTGELAKKIGKLN
ncbi:hypothetical protein [Vibrio sp. ER1A]|uniref:hypothetical protein n=1 Tax=Vibrio sp. ER1A TaxID=1517681 RepID=UPI0004DCEA3D|nr:hypothetical protein [Vibrio sp. ER1A]KFA99443.1 hypothetical protein HW45_03515 [Vibrio sp. ER1A]